MRGHRARKIHEYRSLVLNWSPRSVWEASNQMLFLLLSGCLSFQRSSLKTVAVVSWVLQALDAFPASVAQAAWGDGRLLESWRLLQGVRRQVFNTIQLTPVYLTLKFGYHFLFLHLNFPSSKLGRGQEVRLAAICQSIMRSFILGYMHLFFTICILSLFTVYIHVFIL